MIQNLKDITKRIVDGYQPDRIVLYGSNVDGKTQTESNTDILIIKDFHIFCKGIDTYDATNVLRIQTERTN